MFISLPPATTLRWRLEPGLRSLPRLPGPLLTTFSGKVSTGGGGLRATSTGAARRSNISLWYFCMQPKNIYITIKVCMTMKSQNVIYNKFVDY